MVLGPRPRAIARAAAQVIVILFQKQVSGPHNTIDLARLVRTLELDEGVNEALQLALVVFDGRNLVGQNSGNTFGRFLWVPRNGLRIGLRGSLAGFFGCHEMKLARAAAEGSLAGFFGCHEMALELVCGAVFSCTLMCGAGPGDIP